MISSHQNRIEQLRESFKKKLYDAEKWPEKVSNNLVIKINIQHWNLYVDIFQEGKK